MNAAANRANRVLGSIKRTIKFQTKDTVTRLYKAFVRPHLEYGIQVWNPYLKKDINVLESIQRRATKLVPELSRLSYLDRLNALKLSDLETRRLRGDLIEMFKIVKGLDKVEWYVPIMFKRNEQNAFRTAPRRHDLTIEKQLVKNCEQRFHFFSNRVTNAWNKLSDEIINSKCINEFKCKIDKIDFKKLL